MREIKFRGKQNRTGKWRYGDLWYDKTKNHCAITNHAEDGIYSIDSETVGQYTGMKDKNGTEIYEGDIVKIDDELIWGSMTSCGMEYNSVLVETHALIEWNDEHSAFKVTKTNLGDDECDSQFLYDISPLGNDKRLADEVQHTEVIGNIHDTPELLKEEQR